MGITTLEPIRKAAAWLALVATGTGAVLSTPAPALAAYAHPVTWADMSAMDLRPAFRSQYSSAGNLFEPAIPDSAMLLVLKDADARVSHEFHVPDALKPAVGFWLRIYAEYTTQHVVIYDAHHPELVYEVLDFRQLSKTARNRVVYEIVSKKRVKRAIDAYRQALARLARDPKPRNPSREERNVLAALKKLPHKHSYAELKASLRTQTGQRDNIIKGLLAAEAFFPKMERLFTQMGVPLELTRLTLVESSFNLNAKSKVGAAGVWQFMPKSGREYMTVDEKTEIDERLSPLKATVAAAKLLKRNKKILGHWALATTAFNHGTRGLPRLEASEADFAHFSTLFDACAKDKGKGRKKLKRLGYASRNYYAEFLAVVHAEAYRGLFYGEVPNSLGHPVAFKKIPAGKTGHQLAREFGVPLSTFQLYNPDVQDLARRLPRGFMVALPGESDDLAGLTDALRPRSTKNI